MRVGSLFSGIGGMEYGLERSGLSTSCEWMIEMDEYCCSVLEKNFPNTLVLNSKVEDINPLDLPEIDILTAGFPCQPVSVAGSRKGVTDERWLWDEVWRFIDVLRPRYFILENVPGIFTANKGKAFERVIKDIAESRSYRFEWQVISARTVGASHLRKRFFGVGVLANTNDSGYGTHRSESQREGQESNKGWQGQPFAESSRQSSSSELGNTEHNGSSQSENRESIGECTVSWRQGEEVQEKINRESKGESQDNSILNTEIKSSNETNQQTSSLSKSREARLNIGAGYGREESRVDRETAELWMGSTAYGFPRWMARLGLVNVWTGNIEFPTAAARDWKETYGTVLTGSKTSKRKTLPLEIFRQQRDKIKDLALWEIGMPRSMGDYPDRKARLMALGNAVVPQCVELVGRLIKRSDELGTMVFDTRLLDERH